MNKFIHLIRQNLNCDFSLSKLLVVLFLMVGSQSYSQSLREILTPDKPFSVLVENADSYFEKKHPGRTPFELTIGEYRDSEYVKYCRWKSYWKDRLQPNGYLGDVGNYKLRAMKEKSKNPQSNRSSSDISSVQWDNISHENYIIGQIGMGRTTSIDFHPTDPATFYVGAAKGGVWKTQDGGSTYTQIGDNLPLLAVSDIEIDDDNPSTLYVAVSDHVWYGSAAMGIYVSYDDGGSWVPTSLSFALTDNIRIYSLEADPNDSQTMFAATDQGIYKTEDGWNSSTLVSFAPTHDIRYAANSSNIIFAGGTDGTFYRSTNNGDSFNFISDFGNGFVRISVSDLNTDKVVATNGNRLYVSTNGGSSFGNSSNLPESSMVVAMSPQDEDVIITGNFEVFRSDNSGTSFNKIAAWLPSFSLYEIHVDQRNIHINPLDDTKVYLANDGGIYSYDVTNGNFENLSDGLIITQYYDIGVAQTNSNVVSGGSQDNGSLYRNASGVWVEHATTGDGMVTEVDPTNHNIIYWEYQFGQILRSTNGVSTVVSPPAQGGNGAWETPYKLDPNNPNRIVAGYDRVYESLDQGNTWTEISPPALAFGANLEEIAISQTNGNRIYTSFGSTLYVKDVNSNNWTTRSTPAINGITDLEVDFCSMDKVYITSGSFGDGQKVFVSEDAGITWQNITGSLPNVLVDAIEPYYGTNGGIFIGSSVGVYYRDDNSSDWVEVGSLPHTCVTDLEINYTDKVLFAGTHGRGIFTADISCIELDLADIDMDGIYDCIDPCVGDLVLDPYTSVNGQELVPGSNVSVCEGMSLLLDFDGNYTSDWTFLYIRPDGTAYSGGTNGVLSDQLFIAGFGIVDGNVNEGTWTVLYTDPNGCEGTSEFLVTINPSVSITPFVNMNSGGFVNDNTVILCEGGFFDLGTQAGIQNNIVLTLPDGSTNSNPIGNSYFRILNASSNDAGVYMITYTNDNGCTATQDYSVIINSASITPFVNVNSGGFMNDNSVTLCEGGFFDLGTQAGIQNNIVLTLPDGSMNSNPIGNSYFRISNAATDDSGSYTITYTDSNGCIAIQDYTVTVNANPQLDPFTSVNGEELIPGSNVSVCEGISLLLDFNGNFTSDWTFLYTRPDGATFSGGTNGSLSDQLFIPANGIIDGNVNEGTWTVQYTDSNGCEGNSEFVVVINSATIIPYVRINGDGFINDNTVTLCEGGYFDLGTQAGAQDNITLTLPNGSVSNTPFGNSYFRISNAATDDSGSYTITYTDNDGCIATQEYTVTVNANPQLDPFTSVNGEELIPGTNVSVCEGISVLLDFDGNFTSNWTFLYTRPDGATFNGGANGSLSDQLFIPGNGIIDDNANEGTWTAQYTDPNGCEGTAFFSIDIDATPATTATSTTTPATRSTTTSTSTSTTSSTTTTPASTATCCVFFQIFMI